MKTIEELRILVEKTLQAQTYPAQPVGLYEPISYVLAGGGKRVRPVLLLLAYNLYRDDVERALPAAIGLETYHNHTLLHDDLMDHADVRRGRPTVHKKWDDNTAVLSGDVMLIQAVQHFFALNAERGYEALQLMVRTMQEICEGQQYDVNFEQRDDVALEEYMEMIRLKTSVLLASAAKIGALLGGASEADAETLYRFAEKVGLAFQLQDDYLDVYGDPAVFGKNIGGDILCGKKTFLLIGALTKASAEKRLEILNLINDKTLEPQTKIKMVTDIYDVLDVPSLCQENIETLYAEARRLWESLSLSEERKSALWDFAVSMLKRKS